MRFGFVGPSYTAQSGAVADEECINWFAETNESGDAVVRQQAYGGAEASGLKSYFGTPGLSVFAAFPSGPVRGQYQQNGREFAVADNVFYEVFRDGTFTPLGTVATDGNAVSICANSIQLLIVSGGKAYCFTLGTNVLLEIPANQLAGVPVQCDCSDTIGVLMFQGSNKFQMSQVLDFSSWPGQLVNEVSVFAENINGIKVNHRELWVMGLQRSQVYQDTGSTEVFDVISGALIETGCAAPFSLARLDNSVFWVGQDERGALIAWRSNGYTPSRVSTHAVEVWLSRQQNISQLVSYSYQDRGHLFWVLYVPNSDCSWVYDVGENLWHKRATWSTESATYSPHWSWNHAYAFGKHLVGDWNSGNLYELSFDNLDDNGTLIRRLRRPPIVEDEKKWLYHQQVIADVETGLGPQPPLVDGDGKPRPPLVMLRWSNDRGKTWSNVHVRGCGNAGQYGGIVKWMRLGRSRGRVFELTVTDPIRWTITDAYLEVTE